MSQAQQSEKLGQIIAKAWSDENFKHKLLSDTNATLKAEGVDIPTGFKVLAVENTDQVYHLVLPAKPDAAALSDADRAKLSAASGKDAAKYFCVCSLLLDWSGLVQ